MNRELRRQRAARLLSENRAWPSLPVEVPRSEWPTPVPAGLTAVFRSRSFLVQVYACAAPGVLWLLSVCRAALAPDGDWRGHITWDELQTLKAQIGYGGHWAVEVFPAAGEVVNVASMRHLWVLAEAPPYAWRRMSAAGGIVA